MTSQWREEFGPEFEVPQAVTDRITAGTLLDESWHNDVCPRFITADGRIELWCDHPQTRLRELTLLARFRVYRNTSDARDIYPPDLSETLYEGDDIEAALRHCQ